MNIKLAPKYDKVWFNVSVKEHQGHVKPLQTTLRAVARAVVSFWFGGQL